MPVQFATDEWIKALMTELNRSENYRAAAANWEGDFYWIISGLPGAEKEVYLYVDLWHGACRDAFVAGDPSIRSPEFVIEANYPIWRKVVDKKLDPIQGLVTRQLKLKGNMLKILKAPKAATELVHCATLIDTAWLGG
jgi:putative sterol carrier protein